MDARLTMRIYAPSGVRQIGPVRASIERHDDSDGAGNDRGCPPMTTPLWAGNWRAAVVAIHEKVLKKWRPWSNEDRRFLALALAGEVGELANLVKKDWRGDAGNRGKLIREELADVRIYLELLAIAHDVDLDEACLAKVYELQRRWPEAAGVADRALREEEGQ